MCESGLSAAHQLNAAAPASWTATTMATAPGVDFSEPGTQLPHRVNLGAEMIILGVILLILGLVFELQVLWVIGVVLLVAGAVLYLLGALKRPVLGRKHFW